MIEKSRTNRTLLLSGISHAIPIMPEKTGEYFFDISAAFCKYLKYRVFSKLCEFDSKDDYIDIKYFAPLNLKNIVYITK